MWTQCTSSWTTSRPSSCRSARRSARDCSSSRRPSMRSAAGSPIRRSTCGITVTTIACSLSEPCRSVRLPPLPVRVLARFSRCRLGGRGTPNMCSRAPPHVRREQSQAVLRSVQGRARHPRPLPPSEPVCPPFRHATESHSRRCSLFVSHRSFSTSPSTPCRATKSRAAGLGTRTLRCTPCGTRARTASSSATCTSTYSRARTSQSPLPVRVKSAERLTE